MKPTRNGVSNLEILTHTVGETTTSPEGVVYLRIDRTGQRKPYVGSAKSQSRFEARQQEHARANPNADYEFRELGRAEPGKALAVLEEDYIRELGGPSNKSNPDGGLSNRRHQMSEKRYREAGGKK